MVEVRTGTHKLQIKDEQRDPLANFGAKQTRAPRKQQETEIEIDNSQEPKDLTKKQRQSWRTPSAVSSWNNTKGFMIDRAAQKVTKQQTPGSKFKDLSAALAKAEMQNQRQKDRRREDTQRDEPATDETQFDASVFIKAASSGKSTRDLYDSPLVDTSQPHSSVYRNRRGEESCAGIDIKPVVFTKDDEDN